MSDVDVVRLRADMLAERRAVARLHLEQLPDSDLAALGAGFLYDFSYGVLLADPRYWCIVGRVDGEVAGFTCFSADTMAAYRRGMRTSPFRFGAFLLRAIAARPLAVLALLRMARSSLAARHEPFADVTGEIISTAVAPRFRSLEFRRATGTSVSRWLYREAAQILAGSGVATIKGFTRASNHLVHATISSLGWRKVFEGRLTRSGREDTCIWLWDVGQAAARYRAESLEAAR